MKVLQGLAWVSLRSFYESSYYPTQVFIQNLSIFLIWLFFGFLMKLMMNCDQTLQQVSVISMYWIQHSNWLFFKESQAMSLTRVFFFTYQSFIPAVMRMCYFYLKKTQILIHWFCFFWTYPMSTFPNVSKSIGQIHGTFSSKTHKSWESSEVRFS